MIEKNIHQIWIGDKRIPKHIKEWMQEVKDKHPDFKYHLWNDDNLPQMPKRLKLIYDKIPDPTVTSARSDFLRIYTVYKYGGMYLDADFKTINGFSGSSIDFQNTDGVISVNDSYGTSALGCNFFGFCKGHYFLKLLLDNIVSSDQWLGPNYWALILNKHLGYTDLVDFDRLQKDIEPYNVKLLNTTELEIQYFQHIPLASWLPDSEWNKKLTDDNYE
jgi:mannosyltransferase OCH1-like enzyme